MSRFLQTMAHSSRQRVDEASRSRTIEEMRQAVLAGPGARRLERFGETFDLIAEVKPRSPSEGVFPELAPATAAERYEHGGAAMISVLTEPTEFGGSLPLLQSVREAVSIPIMAKDFLVDPYQVFQAREAGADGILVIARILSDDAMSEILGTAAEIGMFALLEAFDEEDLERISTVAAGKSEILVGVNCRDLDTLDIVPGRHQELAAHLPPGAVSVAESAIAGLADVERVVAMGYNAALVGSALMRAGDTAHLARELIGAGRRTVRVAP